MLTWIETKFGHLIPLLVLYVVVKYCGNPSFVQRLTMILVSSFKRCLGVRVALDLDKI